MPNVLRATWKANRHWLAAGFLFSTGLFAALLYSQHVNAYRGIAESKATGLGAVSGGWDPISLWQQQSILPSVHRSRTVSMMEESSPRVRIAGFVAGVSGGVGSDGETKAERPERQIVRTANLNIVAVDPVDAAEQIRALATRLDGFVTNSTIKGDERSRSAAVQLRVPASRFDEARAQVRRLAKTVEEDTVQAQDVTRQVLDQDAALHNARAEESQYLAILKRAANVKDVLEVTEKLSDVRGEIDQKETDLRYLRQTVEMSLLTVTINAVPQEQRPSAHWHPLLAARLSLVDAVNAMGDFADSLVSLLFYLPVIVAWVLLVFVGLKVGWWTLVRLGRFFFPAMPLWRKHSGEVQVG